MSCGASMSHFVEKNRKWDASTQLFATNRLSYTMHDVCSLGRGQMTINQAISETLQLTHRELAGVIVTLKSRKEIDLRRASHKTPCGWK